MRDSGGAGGEVTFTVCGDAKGTLRIPAVKALTIEGSATGTIRVETIGANGELDIRTDLSGDVSVTGLMKSNATLNVEDSVTTTASITIEDMQSGAGLLFNDVSGTFAEDLILTSGVPAGTTVQLLGQMTGTGSIDLTGDDVALTADLNIDSAAAGAAIVNGGDVDGSVQLTLDSTDNFSGTATFASVSDQVAGEGQILVPAGAAGAGLDGTIHITGSMAGMIDSTWVQTAGLIDVDGDVSGHLDIGTLKGDINVDGDLTSTGLISTDGLASGDMTVDGDANGDMTVGASLRGDISIGGLGDGAVDVAEATSSTSLIHMVDGLGSNGSIVVNSGGAADADGDMLFGPLITPPTLGNITFDGCIKINKSSAGSGDLNGDITVKGCHATSDDLDICVEGSTNGNITIVQTGCTHQVGLDSSCAGTCP